jgi:4-oxalocrotonate tautomerase
MPMINVKVSAAKSAELTAKISQIITELTVRIFKKAPQVISISIDYVDPDHWIVGDRSLSEEKTTSVYYDVKVTDESPNTRECHAERRNHPSRRRGPNAVALMSACTDVGLET